MVYKAEKRGIFYIEPQWEGAWPYRGAYPSIYRYVETPPLYAGESAMLRFNDQWVKGARANQCQYARDGLLGHART